MTDQELNADLTAEELNMDLTAEELEQALAEVEETSSDIPAEVDGVSFDHVGDFDAPEENPDTPPFDIEQALEGVTP